uniref:Uncharacterized protein n=1 Tax=Clastoptera arizonana TaxID=38151 RepID=A0A1B6DDF5_9HEMI
MLNSYFIHIFLMQMNMFFRAPASATLQPLLSSQSDSLSLNKFNCGIIKDFEQFIFDMIPSEDFKVKLCDACNSSEEVGRKDNLNSTNKTKDCVLLMKDSNHQSLAVKFDPIVACTRLLQEWLRKEVGAVETTGRHKNPYRKSFPIIIIAFMMMLAFVIPMGFQFMVMVGGKALLLSQMALIFGLSGAFRKWNFSGYPWNTGSDTAFFDVGLPLRKNTIDRNKPSVNYHLHENQNLKFPYGY